MRNPAHWASIRLVRRTAITTKRSATERESGLTIPLLALFMVVLIVMMALAIDVGVLYTARTSAQHAADAGALAGAYAYGSNPSASNPNGTMTAAAISAATRNKILGTLVPQSEVTVTPNPPFVTVSITHVAPTAFARVMGTNQATITVSATAQALIPPGGQATGTTCLRPFWILRSSLGGCSSTPTPGQALTLHNCNNPSPGNPYCTNPLAPSQWGFIDMGGGAGGGAQAIKNSIMSCQNLNITCGSQLMVETGNISSINNMHPPPEFFGPSTGCPLGDGQDCFNAVGNYSIGGPSGPRSATSQSVVTVAVLDDCNGQTAPQQGSNQALPMTATAFGQIFIDGISGHGNGANPLTIDANLVSFNLCGNSSGGGAGSGPSASYGYPVRLVQQ